MKILHIWDQAGVGCVLAKNHRRCGHEVRILKRAGYDPFGIFQFYGEQLLDIDGKAFLKYAIKEAENYDLVHVHTLYKAIPALRKKYHDKKLVLHYHGSEARDRKDDPVKTEAESDSDAILGSTLDLKSFVENMTHIPNPVDTEHFVSDGRSDDAAFTFKTTRGDSQQVIDYLRKNGINLQIQILDRETNPVSYASMPAFLKRHGIYVDIKFIEGTLLPAMSKTGLESLSCGLRVLDYKLEYVEGLPEEHKPENVASTVLKLYRAIH